MPDEVVVPGEAARHVFVYGTLRRGGSNDIARYRPAPQWVGTASIAGKLFDLAAYPGAVLRDTPHDGDQRAVGDGLIHGEIYRITEAVEAALDVLEEVRADGSGEYIKREIDVESSSPQGTQRLRCLVYEIHPSRVAGRATIHSGDWLHRD
ncbi:gamma-glutamylcyclotransferase [soil metagenome]